jgi:ribonuclease Z
MKPPRIVLLGTGTAVPDQERDFTHLVWDGPGGPFLVDAGGSTYQRLQQAGVDPQALTGILITHTHCDHVNGLPALLFSLYVAGRRDPSQAVPVYGLPYTIEFCQNLLANFDLEQYVAPVEWRPFAAGDTIPLPTDEWTLRTAPTEHSRPCVALRWEEVKTGHAFAYSCDTAPCPPVIELAQGAELLIHEATTPGPMPGVHTSPREAGEVAARTGAKRLVMVHFSPRWTMTESQAVEEAHAGGFKGVAEVGRDSQELTLSAL